MAVFVGIELRVKAGGEQRVLLECGNSGRTTASQRLQSTEKHVFMDSALLYTHITTPYCTYAYTVHVTF